MWRKISTHVEVRKGEDEKCAVETKMGGGGKGETDGVRKTQSTRMRERRWWGEGRNGRVGGGRVREGYSRMHLTNQGLTAVARANGKAAVAPLPPTKRDSDLQAGKLKETRREAGQFKLVLDTFLSASSVRRQECRCAFTKFRLFIARLHTWSSTFVHNAAALIV